MPTPCGANSPTNAQRRDTGGVTAAGFDPFDVARAHLDAVPEALSIATALSMDPMS